MHKKIKLVTIICLFSLIIGILPLQQAAFSAEEAFKTETNIECENITLGSGPVIESDDQASGGKHVAANGSRLSSSSEISNADMTFSVDIPADGTYSVYANVIIKDDGCDSFYYKWDETDWKEVHLGAQGSSYVRTKLLTQNLTKGVHTFYWNHREAGAVYDYFYVTAESITPVVNTVVQSTPAGTSASAPKAANTVKNSKVDEFPERYPLPSITPPPEHPRVWFRESDIPNILRNLELDYCAIAKSAYVNRAKTEFDGTMTPIAGSTSTYDSYKLELVQAKALKYALEKDEAVGKEAVSAMKNVIKTVKFEQITDNTRQMGHVLRIAGMVYDWCYPLLSTQDKEDIVSGCQNISKGMEIGYPPSGQGAVTGHGSEAQLLKDWLCLAIACYDEYPSIYNFVAGRILSEYIEPREYYDAASGSQHQGNSYGQGRYQASLEVQWLFYRMSGQKIFSDQFGEVPYQFIYYRRPDGQLLREGDDYSETYSSRTQYWNDHVSMMYYAASFYKNPIFLKDALIQNSDFSDFIIMLILNDPDLGTQDKKTLPLSRYFSSPNGMYVARTSWEDGYDSPAVVAQMKIGETWAANHHHLDFGSFQIYYKGALASESGCYDSYFSAHDKNYNKQTIAHNSLLIYDPNEQMYGGIVNSGGQRTAGGEVATYEQWMSGGNYNYGKVLAHEAGPTLQKPEYTYISGDITNAYSSKASEVLRSMIFIPEDNPEIPAIFMVMDKVTSTDKSFKKTWLLHTQQEPEIDGNVSVVKRDTDGYNGKLTNQTLLPKNASITKTGGAGNEFSINGMNYPKAATDPNAVLEAGWGRIEVSPQNEQNTDYFLNVMYVSDADNALPVQNATLIETSKFVGALILDKAVIFAKDKNNADETIEFTIPATDQNLKIAVAGIKPGTWEVYKDGSLIDTQIASGGGKIIYFGGNSGSYTLKYTSSNSNKVIPQGEVPSTSGIRIRVKGQFLYTDVEPILVNNRTLVPARAIFEAIGATVNYDESTETATAVKNDITVTITKDSSDAYVNGEKHTLDVPATMINDRFLVPVRFVSEAFNCKVGWDDWTQIVSISNIQ